MCIEAEIKNTRYNILLKLIWFSLKQPKYVGRP